VAIHLHPSIRLYDLTLNQAERQVYRMRKEEVVSCRIRFCGFDVLYFLHALTFRRNLSPPSLGSESELIKNVAEAQLGASFCKFIA
jgi:hypothetical protein